MDDQRHEPSASARRSTPSSAAAAVPTRTRTGRPIRFTPSHAHPAAPPPPAPPHVLDASTGPAGSSVVGRAFVWLLVLAGWAVFATWWVVVLQRETLHSFGVASGLLGATILVSTVAMALWTRHNLRIARGGNRGTSSRYIPMVFERDVLGRTLELPADDLARAAAEVRLIVRDGVKTYAVPDAEEL